MWFEGMDYIDNHNDDLVNTSMNLKSYSKMKFKQFVKWCADSVCVGYLGIRESDLSIRVIKLVYEQPFYKHEKYWHKNFESLIISAIVNPTNTKIMEVITDE